jgi:3-hydroxybutyryl-CoA dehydrogenase
MEIRKIGVVGAGQMGSGIAEVTITDFVDLGTVLSVMKVLQEACGDKYRPCPLLHKYLEAGYLGVKAGRGFYEYGGKR